jgi:hypothetical protein
MLRSQSRRSNHVRQPCSGSQGCAAGGLQSGHPRSHRRQLHQFCVISVKEGDNLLVAISCTTRRLQDFIRLCMVEML